MVGDVNVDRQLQFGALLPDGIEARIVKVQALRPGQGGALDAAAFVGDLTDAAGTLAVAALQFANGALGVVGGFQVVGVERAPELKAFGVAGEEFGLAVELRARRQRFGPGSGPCGRGRR
jgi:hypothetical protein